MVRKLTWAILAVGLLPFVLGEVFPGRADQTCTEESCGSQCAESQPEGTTTIPCCVFDPNRCLCCPWTTTCPDPNSHPTERWDGGGCQCEETSCAQHCNGHCLDNQCTPNCLEGEVCMDSVCQAGWGWRF